MDHTASNKGEREPKCGLKGVVLDPSGAGVADVVVTATSIEFNHDYVATTDSDGAFFIPVPGPLAASPVAYSVKTALMTDPPTQVVDVEPGCSDAVDVEAFSLRSAGGTGPNGT